MRGVVNEWFYYIVYCTVLGKINISYHTVPYHSYVEKWKAKETEEDQRDIWTRMWSTGWGGASVLVVGQQQKVG